MNASAKPAAPRGGFFVQVVPALLYTFAIFYGGMAPQPHLHAPISHFDKVLHAVAFGFMQLVVLRAVRYEGSKLAFRAQNLLAFGVVVAVGGLLELVQMTMSYRSAELLDWLADAIGAGAVAAVLDWYARRSAERAQESCAPPREPEG